MTLTLTSNATSIKGDYSIYHAEISRAEELIVRQSFAEALEIYRGLFDRYEFVFVRDYKVATQIAWQLGFEEEAYEYLRLGIAGGWKMRSIKRNKFLRDLRGHRNWSELKRRYDSLRTIYKQNLNQELTAEVRKLSVRDRRRAFGSIFRLSSKSRDRFGEKRFAPLNERHVLKLLEIIETEGFPGEKLVGFEPWAQGILSRHNSISKAYSESDTMYAFIRPLLLSSIKEGNLSPASFAWIDEWFITVESGWSVGSYGFLNQLKETEVPKSNEMRQRIGMRKIEIRNRLIDLQNETQMDFYLPPWSRNNKKILAR